MQKKPPTDIPLFDMIHKQLHQFPLVVLPYNQEDLRPHTHDFMEFVYIRHGSGMHLHGDHTYPIFYGDCFMVLPGDAHGYQSVDGLRIVNILFYPRLLDPCLKDLRTVGGFNQFFSLEPLWRSSTGFKYKLHLSPAQNDWTNRILTEITNELDKEKNGYQTLCTGLFYGLIVSISRFFEENNQEQPSVPKEESQQKRIAKAISFIESQFDREFSLAEVAEAVSVSPSHLAHVFKETTGLSIFEYLLRFRIDKAKSLLKNTDLSITEITFSTGFNDSSYFSRAFKKLTCTTPLQFRSK